MIPESLRDNPVAAALDDLATTAKFDFDELTIEIAPENIVEALRRLKQELKFERLSTVTGVDRYPAEPRFEVVYHLQSVARKAAAAAESAVVRAKIPRSNRPARFTARPTGMSGRCSISSACAFLQSSRPDAHHDAARIGRGIRCARTTR